MTLRIREALEIERSKNPNFMWREQPVLRDFWGTAFIFPKRTDALKISKATGLHFAAHFKEWAITIF